MKVFALVLVVLLALLQIRLWVSDDGVRDVRRLEAAVEVQEEENRRLRSRNDQLAAEVKDLKVGLAAVEERARSDLGMIGANETFYQVAPADEPAADPSLAQPPGTETPARQAATQ